MTKIGIIIGSTRQGRIAPQIANWFSDEVATNYDNVEFEYLDLADFPLPFFDSSLIPSQITNFDYPHDIVRQWSAQIRALDAFVMIAPEYNRSPSAVAKNAMDWLYAEWDKKPIGFIGYGGTGGARAIEHLRSVALNLGLMNARAHVAIADYLDAAGNLAIDAKYVSAGKAMVDEILVLDGVLKPLRR